MHGSVWAVFGDSTLARLDGRGTSPRRRPWPAPSPRESSLRVGSVWVSELRRRNGSALQPGHVRAGRGAAVSASAGEPTGSPTAKERSGSRTRPTIPSRGSTRSRARPARSTSDAGRSPSRSGSGSVWVANTAERPSRASTRRRTTSWRRSRSVTRRTVLPSATARLDRRAGAVDGRATSRDRRRSGRARAAARCSRRASRRASAR